MCVCADGQCDGKRRNNHASSQFAEPFCEGDKSGDRKQIEQDGFQRVLGGQIGEPSCIPLLAMNAALAVARFEVATQQQEAACRRLLALETRSERFHNEVSG